MRTVLKYGGVAAIVILLACPALHAQNQLLVNLGYNVNVPTGSFRDFINHPGYKGFNLGLAYPVNDQLSLGLNFGYNDFYQKYPRQVYNNGKGSDISAVLSNSIQQLPLLVTANYALIKEGIVRPYVGAGAGLNFISFDQYLGELILIGQVLQLFSNVMRFQGILFLATQYVTRKPKSGNHLHWPHRVDIQPTVTL